MPNIIEYVAIATITLMKSRLDNMTGFAGSGREAGSRWLRSGIVYILLASR